MQRRLQRYWRRPRSAFDDEGEPVMSDIAVADGDGAPRGRRRRPHFFERMEATRALVGYSALDEISVEQSRSIILPHLDEMTEIIYDGLVSRPETAVYFAERNGTIDPDQLAVRTETFRTWVVTMIEGEMDPQTAEYLASVGHAHVRPREGQGEAVRARYLLVTMSRLQAFLTAALSAEITDPAELGECVVAWCKRTMIHLDLLLSVYSATERSPHWY